MFLLRDHYPEARAKQIIVATGSLQRLDARHPGDRGKRGEILRGHHAQADAVERAVASRKDPIGGDALAVETLGREIEDHDDVARAARALERRTEPGAGGPHAGPSRTAE